MMNAKLIYTFIDWIRMDWLSFSNWLGEKYTRFVLNAVSHWNKHKEQQENASFGKYARAQVFTSAPRLCVYQATHSSNSAGSGFALNVLFFSRRVSMMHHFLLSYRKQSNTLIIAHALAYTSITDANIFIFLCSNESRSPPFESCMQTYQYIIYQFFLWHSVPYSLCAIVLFIVNESTISWI